MSTSTTTATTTAATSAVDAPSTPAIHARPDGRSIEASWPIGERYTRSFGSETCQDAVVLSCSHSSHRRGFTALLRVQTELYRGERRVGTSFALLGDTVRLPGEPITRYSAKRLQEFFDRTLIAVRQARARGEYEQLFTPAQREA
jgi:hypothetical protein